MATWDDAVDRETAWFQAEPPATFSSAPALHKSAGGPFDHVQAYRPKNMPARGRWLYIYRDYRSPQREKVTDMGERRIHEHRLLAHILWKFEEKTRKAEDSERHLEEAIARVLTRIRGPQGDKTHAGATEGAEGFNDVADVNDEPTVEFLDDPLDAIRTSQSVQVLITYAANDSFFG
jgi:hypothetical protein